MTRRLDHEKRNRRSAETEAQCSRRQAEAALAWRALKPSVEARRRSGRVIAARYSGRCLACGEEIEIGTRVIWHADRGVEHLADECDAKTIVTNVVSSTV